MDKIDSYRKKIDEIDAKLIDLLTLRFNIVGQVAKFKKSKSIPIYDPKREQLLLKKIDKLSKSRGLDVQDVRKIFIDIMYASKRKQSQNIFSDPVSFDTRNIKIAFQGELGAYSETAVLKSFPNSTPIGFKWFNDAFEALLTSKVEVAVIPVENSTYGSVLPVYDLVSDIDVIAVGEVFLQIEHCLLSLPDSKLEDIKEVYSHYQALAQCSNYIKKLGVLPKEYFDTAGAAKMVSEKKDLSIAAIASENAAKHYGLKILQKGVQDLSNNITRFLIFVRGNEVGKWLSTSRKGNYKTSLIFSVPHTSGSLFKSLEVLARNKINLTKIESRPTGQVAWEYLFYIDFIGNITAPKVRKILKEFESKTQYLKIIGCYPTGE